MSRRNGFTIIELLVVVAILLIIGAIAFHSCGNGLGFTINDADFYRLMSQEGVQNPVKGSYQYGACADSDSYNSLFTGFKNGQRVNGVVCKGYMKGFTIRYF